MIFPALSPVLERDRSNTDSRLPTVTFWADRKILCGLSLPLAVEAGGPDAGG